MLDANRDRVRRLTGLEIWGFIVGRVLVAFGLGVLAAVRAPSLAIPAAWPAVLVGLAILMFAGRGMLRRRPNDPMNVDRG